MMIIIMNFIYIVEMNNYKNMVRRLNIIYYHISWLEKAIEVLKNDTKSISVVNGDITIQEFLEKHIGNELKNVIDLSKN